MEISGGRRLVWREIEVTGEMSGRRRGCVGQRRRATGRTTGAGTRGARYWGDPRAAMGQGYSHNGLSSDMPGASHVNAPYLPYTASAHRASNAVATL